MDLIKGNQSTKNMIKLKIILAYSKTINYVNSKSKSMHSLERIYKRICELDPTFSLRNWIGQYNTYILYITQLFRTE